MRDEEALGLVRLLRHNFLNHLQVISGWLQLGQAERASAYLNQVAARLAGESQGARDLNPSLALALLAAAAQAETHGVTLQWHLPPALAIEDPAKVTALRETLLAAVNGLGPSGDQHPHLQVEVSAGTGGITVAISAAVPILAPMPDGLADCIASARGVLAGTAAGSVTLYLPD